MARDDLGDGGYLRRSRSSQSTGCGLLDLGDACEYEKWVAGGVGWFGVGRDLFMYLYVGIHTKKNKKTIEHKSVHGRGGIWVGVLNPFWVRGVGFLTMMFILVFLHSFFFFLKGTSRTWRYFARY